MTHDKKEKRIMLWCRFLRCAPLRVCWHRIVWCRKNITQYENNTWSAIFPGSRVWWECECGWQLGLYGMHATKFRKVPE